MADATSSSLPDGALDLGPTALLDSALAGAELKIGGIRCTLLEPKAAGMKGAVWFARNQYGRDRAVKLAFKSAYGRRSPVTELELAMSLEEYSCFARLEAGELVQVQLSGGPVNVIAFVSQWLDGHSLADLLAGSVGEVSTSVILAYVRDLTDALAALQAQSLIHDDLNFGNVFAVRPPIGLRASGHEFKVLDLGSLKRVDQHDPVQKAGFDDYRWVALHLSALHNVCKRRRANSGRDRRFLRELLEIVHALLEDDPIRRLADAHSLHEQVESAWSRSGDPGPRAPAGPFEFISAEQIADDLVLRQLFAESLPWLDEVNSATPQLITGPRGCGKSTLFRWISLKTQLRAGPPPSAIPKISGFYISCTIELQNRFGWMTKESDMTDERRAEVVHFFNLLLIRELVRTLALASDVGPPVGLEVSPDDEQFVVRIVAEALHGWEPVLFRGVSPLRQLAQHIRTELVDCHFRARFGGAQGRPLTTESTIADVTSSLIERFPFFRQHPIVFLIDDFSYHRIPGVVQRVLHPVIWHRGASHTFKVSAEKNGTAVALASGATAELSREMIERDVGSIALAPDLAPLLKRFTVDLLDARLKACGFGATAETLIGHSEWGNDASGRPLSLAEHLRATKGQKGGQSTAYHGLECIADLCTGDVSTLLLVFERILRSGSVTATSTATVGKAKQSRAIRSVSTELVEQLRAYYGTGVRMHAFVTEFGRFVTDVLMDAKTQPKGEDQADQPQQIPRIEVDSIAAVHTRLDATPELREVFDDLIRRAVLIEMPMTRGRHAGETALSLHLRRVFLPSFAAALGKNTALTTTAEEFAGLLQDPATQFKMFRRRRIVDVQSDSLFDGFESAN